MPRPLLTAVLLIFAAMTTSAGVNRWTVTLEGVAAHEVAIDPADPAVVYVATDAGVFKTTDRGRQWTIVDGLADARTIAINPADSTNVVAGNLSFVTRPFGAAISPNSLCFCGVSTAVKPGLTSPTA